MQIRLFSSLFTHWQHMNPAPGPLLGENYSEEPVGPQLPPLLLTGSGPS